MQVSYQKTIKEIKEHLIIEFNNVGKIITKRQGKNIECDEWVGYQRGIRLCIDLLEDCEVID